MFCFVDIYYVYHVDASDDSSPALSPDISPIGSPQSVWKDRDFQILPPRSAEATPTHVTYSSKSDRPSRVSLVSSVASGNDSCTTNTGQESTITSFTIADHHEAFSSSSSGSHPTKQSSSSTKFSERRDPSPTPYYRKLAMAIALADQELKRNYSQSCRRLSEAYPRLFMTVPFKKAYSFKSKRNVLIRPVLFIITLVFYSNA